MSKIKPPAKKMNANRNHQAFLAHTILRHLSTLAIVLAVLRSCITCSSSLKSSIRNCVESISVPLTQRHAKLQKIAAMSGRRKRGFIFKNVQRVVSKPAIPTTPRALLSIVSQRFNSICKFSIPISITTSSKLFILSPESNICFKTLINGG